jgi:muramidase (phage lysozyme)
MLDLTTLVAVSIMGTAATPVKPFVEPTPVQQIAIREIAPDRYLDPSPICTGCDTIKIPLSPAYDLTPERRALLNTIRFAEGTWANGQEIGYRVMFGGSLAPSLDRHPDRVMRTSGYASAAAGAYQFMPGTWDEASRKLSLRNFGVENQDQAAIYLIEKRGALRLADNGEMTPQLAALLAPEWASFPTLSGRSYYGQPVKRFQELKRFYDQNLAMLKGGSGEVR